MEILNLKISTQMDYSAAVQTGNIVSVISHYLIITKQILKKCVCTTVKGFQLMTAQCFQMENLHQLDKQTRGVGWDSMAI